MLGGGLDTGLCGVGEQTTCDTEEDLCANNTGVVCATGAATVVDEQTEGDGEEGGAGNDERLEVVDEADDDTGDQPRDDGDEAVQRCDARSRLNGLAKRHNEDGVQVVTLHVPSRVEHDSDEQGAPNTAVLKEAEGDHGVLAVLLPEDEDGNSEDADDEGRDDVRGLPGLLDAAGEGEGNENEGKDGDDEDDAYDVKLQE